MKRKTHCMLMAALNAKIFMQNPKKQQQLDDFMKPRISFCAAMLPQLLLVFMSTIYHDLKALSPA